MAMSHGPDRHRGDRRLARLVVQPVSRFLAIEASGGILLLAGTLAALTWANSPWSAGYEQLWRTSTALEVGSVSLPEDLRHWVNDGLMALFFLVVGLEIKRELVAGELANRRDATLPVIAAFGGMVVPAMVFLVVNAGGSGSVGWGIPMATDIAFAVGVLLLLGDRVPASLKVLLLGLAVADDIGAIAVIAFFYTDVVVAGWLVAAAAALVVVVLLGRTRTWFIPAFVVVGTVVWVCIHESGVHATIAGVALGLVVPVPVAERLETALHPWTSYVVIPIFALANAGIPLRGAALGDAATSPITLGVVLGLVVGKLVGVAGAAWLAVRFRLARLPEDVTWRHMVGLAGLAGIGFTVSIFVAGLAYGDAGHQEEAKVGVLLASILAAAIGSTLLVRAPGARPAGSARKISGSTFRGAGGG